MVINKFCREAEVMCSRKGGEFLIATHLEIAKNSITLHMIQAASDFRLDQVALLQSRIIGD